VWGCEQRSDDDRRNKGIAETETKQGAEEQWHGGGNKAEDDRAGLRPAEQGYIVRNCAAPNSLVRRRRSSTYVTGSSGHRRFISPSYCRPSTPGILMSERTAISAGSMSPDSRSSGIEYRINERQVFRRGSEQRYRNDHICRSPAREPQQFGGWIETKDVGDCRAIEGQVHPRPDADLKNQTSRDLDRPLAIMVE